ncbi:MAG: hypothetical protein K6E63_01770 [Lachnospiraceae bacterium]|nr:hypothetical protein [Lachnospiraceae bacterium]
MKSNMADRSKRIPVAAKLLCGLLGVFLFAVISAAVVVKADSPGPFTVTEDTSMTVDVLAAMLEQVKYTSININNCTFTIKGGITSSIPINIGENGKLVIEGSYIQKDSSLGLGNNAELIVSGDISFTGYGYLCENMATSKATIGGNFIYTSSVKSPTYVAGGNSNTNRAQWTIGGDIIENTTEGHIGFDKVFLNGAGEQKISMQSGYIYNLTDLVSTSAVVVEDHLNYTKLLSDMTIKTGTDAAFNGINTGGNTIIIDGNLIGEGGITVSEESNLTVNGDYVQRSGGLSLENNSVFTVNGNAAFSNSGYFNGNIATAKVYISDDLNYTSTSNSPTYTAGNNSHANRAEWFVAGSITQGEGSGHCGFNTLILTGSGEQQLVFNSNSYLDTLTTSESVTAVSVKGYLNGTKFNNDMTIKPDTGFIFSGTNAGGHNIVVEGDLIAENGLNISSESNVTVNGNYQLKSGGFSLDYNAVFTVKGNATFSNSGYFNGNNETAKVYISGDLNYTSTSNSPTYTAGSSSHTNKAEWSVTGSITQGEGSGNCGFNNLVLSGTGDQKVALNSNSYLDNLTTAESVTAVSVNGYLNGTKFNNDMTIKPDNGFVFAGNNAGGHNIIIEGDLIAQDSLNISPESNVTVKGDFQLKSGGLSLEYNTVFTVTGNATFSNNAYYRENASSAKVYIGGDLNYTTSTNSPTYTAGNNSHTNRAEWSVAGNITQADDSGTFGFNNIILSGTGNQRLILNSKSYFENLTVAKTVTGVELNGEISAGKLTVNSPDATIVLNGLLKNTVFESDAKIVNGTGAFFNNIKINGHTVNVNGDTVFQDGVVDLADFSTLNITGTMNLNKNAYVTIGTNGKVTVTKDMVLSDSTNLALTLDTAKVNVGGDFLYTSTKATTSNGAKFYVTGNVTQGEDAGALRFSTLNMLTKNTAVTLTNGHIDKLILAGVLADYTITPPDCYTTVEENSKPEPGPGPGPGPEPEPEDEIDTSENGGATDTQPDIDKDTTSIVLVKGQKFILNAADWNSSNSTVVSVSKGKVTAKKAGSATLSRSGQEIKADVIEPTVSKEDKTIKLIVGEAGKIVLSGTGELDVLYASDQPDIAAVDDEGNVAAISKGNTPVYAYVNGVPFKFTVKVADANTAKKDFAKEVQLVPNQTIAFKQAGFKASKAAWTSDTAAEAEDIPKGYIFADDVVKINKSGKITAIGAGSTVLTGTDEGGNTATVTIVVSEPVVQTMHLNKGGSAKIKLYGVKGDLKWTAEDDILEIKKGNSIKALSAGNTVLTATYEKFEYKVNVFVEDPEIKDTDFTGKPYTYTINMKAGDTKTIQFSHMSADHEVTFISSRNDIAYAGSDLVICARNKGKATLKTKINGKAVTIKVNVM